MMPNRRRPVPRRRVAIGAAGVLLLLIAVLGVGELLRHPDQPTDVPEEQLAGADPRDVTVCPEPQPREGQRRDTQDETAQPLQVSSSQLFDCPQAYDGQRVVYRGEVVGALLQRDSGVWAQLNDDLYAELLGPLPAHRNYQGGNAGVGVLLPPQVAAEVSYVGGPQTRGDVLEVSGTFHRVDATGEVAVIHAVGGQLTTDGTPFPDPPLADRRIAAIIALLVAAGTVVAERVVASRR